MNRLPVLLFFLFLQVFLQAQTLTSSNLPIIIINTNGQTIVDDPKITADMGIILIDGMKKWQTGIYYFIFSDKNGEKVTRKVMKH